MPAQPGGLNILPKKNWHVRTKENIAKVRRDEAKAAEEERQRIERAALAEREARTALLRKRAAERLGGHDVEEAVPSTSAIDTAPPLEHVNFFADLEEQHRTFGKNKGHEADKKVDQEKWERQIGLLKYLGEGSKEHSGETLWYERAKESMPSGMAATHVAVARTTVTNDRKYESISNKRRHHSSDSDGGKASGKAKKHKTKKSKFSHDSADIEKLRADRLRREREERAKADKLMKMAGIPCEDDTVKNEPEKLVKQKYNSQFMPDICRQNR